MAKLKIDPVDVALSIALMISGFIMVGIASYQLFGIDFGATATTIGGYDLTTAYVMSVLAFGGIIATNDNTSFSDLRSDVEGMTGEYAQYYAYAVFGTVALMLAWVLLPDTVASFFQSSDLWGLLYVGITTTAGYVVGWIL